MSMSFTAMVVEQPEPKKFTRRIGTRSLEDLPAGDVVIRVAYSSLNYKDALSATGHPGVSRKFPHTPGIDAAGEVVSSENEAFKPGDEVIVTGFDLGMNTPGGFGQLIRVPAAWVVPKPDGLTLRETMILGTAGFTAALSVWKLEQNGVAPCSGDILVTGAGGGVGSLAVALLAKAGYRVVAGSSKDPDYLKQLGAAEVIGREEVLKDADRPMTKERWGGVVDVVGGDTLAAAIKSTRYGGSVTCCGLVGSADLNLNVYPFILRGVSLLGIDSVECAMGPRLQVWQRLAGPWKLDILNEVVNECTLDTLEEKIQAILKGQVRGRTLVKLPTT